MLAWIYDGIVQLADIHVDVHPGICGFKISINSHAVKLRRALASSFLGLYAELAYGMALMLTELDLFPEAAQLAHAIPFPLLSPRLFQRSQLSVQKLLRDLIPRVKLSHYHPPPHHGSTRSQFTTSSPPHSEFS